MRHASFFTGLGGFDLAAEWMGWENVFQCEKDPYCQKLLKQNFPNTVKYGKIEETDFKPWRGAVDILSGGFPCQPYSIAGLRRGTEDERHLWPEMRRGIYEIQPPWVVGENVRGLTNWNGGLVFDEVQTDLEAAGYEVTPFLLPAAGVNAPHERYRIWFIAYSGCQLSYRGESNESKSSINNWKDDRREETSNIIERLSMPGIITNTFNEGLEGDRHNAAICGQNTRHVIGSAWNTWPTEPQVCGRNARISNRIDRIKALGNAVVPQVVLQIFKAIQKYENDNSSADKEV